MSNHFSYSIFTRSIIVCGDSDVSAQHNTSGLSSARSRCRRSGVHVVIRAPYAPSGCSLAPARAPPLASPASGAPGHRGTDAPSRPLRSQRGSSDFKKAIHDTQFDQIIIHGLSFIQELLIYVCFPSGSWFTPVIPLPLPSLS